RLLPPDLVTSEISAIMRRPAANVDLLTAPREELLAHIQARQAERQQLLHTATHDQLTGLTNKMHTEELLRREVARASRAERSGNTYDLSLLYLDLNKFNRINTEPGLGRAVGDLVLQRFSEALGDATRQYDIKARFGGDEFCVVSPETNSA